MIKDVLEKIKEEFKIYPAPEIFDHHISIDEELYV